MNIVLCPPGTDLIRRVASELVPDGRDYSRSWIIFPEKRPAFYLRKTLGAREGGAFIPPRIDSLDGFVDRVHAEIPGSKGRPLEMLDAVSLLFDIHRRSPDRLGRRHYLSADRFFPVGVKLFRDLEELSMAGLEPADILKTDLWTEEKIPHESRSRLQSLSFFYERFFDLLELKGFSTQSRRYRDVAAKADPALFPGIRKIIVAGFFSLTRMEKKLVRTIGSWDGSVLIFVEGRGIAPLLEEFGSGDRASRSETASPPPGPRFYFTKSSDTHGQVFALNRAMENLLKDRTRLHEQQVIVLPAAETLFPLYQQTLSVLPEDAYNISLGYPLGRTPIFTFFDKLLELLLSADEEGRIYVPHYLRFILHPYTKNVYFPGPGKRSDLTRILVHSLEDALVQTRMKAFRSLEDLETDPEIWDEVQARIEGIEDPPPLREFQDHLRALHACLLIPFRDIRHVGDFAEKTIQVLNFIYETSTARLHYFFHPYAEAFIDRLTALAKSLLRDTVFEDKGSYANLFRKVIAAGTVPFFGTPLRGLQVLGFWETRGIPFKDVFILDVNEGTIPSASRADSLLPFAARRALGLPTYRDYEIRMEYYLETLLQGAENVHLFFVENNDREKSRFVERLLWEQQKRDGEPNAESYVKSVQYRVALQASKPEAVPKTRDVLEYLRRFSFSATSLDSYLHCPLQFYYAYVLNLREKEKVRDEMERKDIGTFVHGILEEFYRSFVGRTLRRGDLDPAAMGRTIDRRFRQSYGPEESGNAYLMRIQIRRHLEDFLTAYQIPLLGDLADQDRTLMILSLEQRLQVERDFGGRTYRLAAKVDRTELRGEDLFVLDYKTGAREKSLGINFKKLNPQKRESWPEAIRSLQLPFYNLILAQYHRKPSPDVRCRLVMIGKATLEPGIEYSPFGETDRTVHADQIRTMETVIGGLLTEICDPQSPFGSSADPARTCSECPYAVLCDRTM